MGCDRPRARRDIDALFVHGLSTRRWRALREHLYACAECRTYYDRVMLLDRKLAGDGAPLSPAQLALVGGQVVDAVAAGRTPGRRASAWLRALGGDRGRLGWALGTATAALLVAAVVMPAVLHGLRARDEFQSRGVAGGSGTGVRAVCVASEPGPEPFVRAVLPGGADGRGATCRRSDTLHFTYANVAPGAGAPFEYLFVVGIDASLQPHWYYPQEEEGSSIRLAAGALEEGRLPGGIALSVRHGVGPVRVYALFSHRPVTVEEVARRVEAWRAEGRRLESLPALGVGGGIETTFVLPIGE